jgi:hypothetical protein
MRARPESGFTGLLAKTLHSSRGRFSRRQRRRMLRPPFAPNWNVSEPTCSRPTAEENAGARQTAEQRACQEAEERATWEQLATEAEQERQTLRARLDAAQRLAEAAPVNFQEVIEQGEAAAQKIDLDDAATRQIVDQQLRDRGWEADTQKLTYAAGARPPKAAPWLSPNGRPKADRPTTPFFSG